RGAAGAVGSRRTARLLAPTVDRAAGLWAAGSWAAGSRPAGAGSLRWPHAVPARTATASAATAATGARTADHRRWAGAAGGTSTGLGSRRPGSADVAA